VSNRNHGRALDVMPDVRPARAMFAASVAVESMMF
jgi:hypothetical protein